MSKRISKLEQMINGLKYDAEKVKEKLLNAWDDFLFLVKIKKYDYSSPFDSYSTEELEKLKAKYYELEELCINSTDSKVIDKIIQEHSKCITAETCETCLLIEDTKYSNPDFEYPWLILARNKYLSYKQHHKLYFMCITWQEMTDSYIMNLILNSNLEAKTRQLIIEHPEFMVGHGNGHLLPELYEEMLNHPDFTQKDLKKFLDGGWDFTEELNQMYEKKYGSKE
jgi:hypothetical protein